MKNLPPKPQDALWTDEQWQAIMTRDQTTLVSAAAGSGKTAVLVERIIQQLLSEDNPVDVDRLLVVTFTEAAAAEMRQRVGDALEEALQTQPANLHLRRQLSLLNRASISTFHAFCGDVLRTYYYKIGLDPSFRILEETEAVLMREEIIEDLFEDYYGDIENDLFFKLVDAYSSDRSDEPLQRLVEELYDFSRSHPWPNVWLDDVVAQYDLSENVEMATIPWVAHLLTMIKQELHETLTLLEQAEQHIDSPSGPEPYREAVRSDKQQLQHLIAVADDWNQLYEAFQTIQFPRLNPVRKNDDVSPQLQDNVRSLRNTAKESIESLQVTYFERSLQDYLEDMLEIAPLMKVLVELVTEFGERFFALKMEKAVLDFSDLEHNCLRILLEENSSPDELMPSDAAFDFKDQFYEVLVDEYQDTNLVQETIIQLVSKENNLFMVGDVKQSIYRFRLADPTLFLQKYKDFSQTGNESGLRIDLAKNFRSREEVLHGTNFIFRQIMDELIGELDYDEAAELKHGFPYPESKNCELEFFLIDREGEEEEELPEEVEEAAREELEARFIANKIKKLVGKDSEEATLIFDTKLKRMRPVTYRDIVILSRSVKSSASMVMEELKKQGIPAYIEMSEGYFDATEIATMMSLLQIIDNPDQDIPLASVLRSPLVGLTEDELARIRIASKKSSYFHAMQMYMQEHEGNELASKLHTFYEQVKQWRTAARQGALSELIWQLYRDTKYYDFVGGLPGGVQRQANLRALYDRARQYEKTSFRGLFRFLRFIERMKDKGKDLGTAKALGEQEDVVRLMTIHSSKGLEFPVVFLSGLSKQFYMRDLYENVLFHKESGVGMKYVDPERRISYPTLLHQGIKQQLYAELIAEEMRLLYVAMTRAREKLYLIGTVKGVEKEVQKWQIHLHNDEWLLSDYARRNSKSFLDWIGPALIRHKQSETLRDFCEEKEVRAPNVYTDDSSWKITCFHARDLTMEDDVQQLEDQEKLERIKASEEVEVEAEEGDRVFHQLSWAYKQHELTEIKAKQTVTELKRQREVIDEQSDQAYVASFQHPAEERPRFLQKTKITAAERGTAMHTFMQHVSFKQMTPDHLQNTLSRLVQNEILTDEQANAIDLPLVSAFSETELFTRIRNARETYREIPFTYTVPALEQSEERVIIQGVIDLVVEEDDGLLLIDYKTDAITGRFSSFEEALPVLRKRYEVQLNLYEQAIYNIWKKRVKAKYLYFFDGSHILEL